MRFSNPIVYCAVKPKPVPTPKEQAATRQRTRTLRERWPFLNQRDCPVELQALVTQRITDYYHFTALYQQLRQCTTESECAQTAGALLEAYFDARAIAHELDYYGRHLKVLGHHPFFKHFRELNQLRSKTYAELFHERELTRGNIWRVNDEIKKGNKPHLEAKRRAKLKQYELKLQEINRLIGE